MRQRLVTVAVVFGGLAVVGALVAVSGVVPIAGSSGHWPVTRWFLEFTKERSVSTHTLGMEPLSFDEPWLVLKGAGHFETGCRSCHGAPGHPVPGVARAMLPSPPELAPRIARWDPEELFYIVKHGIKFTGMPAWPSRDRDDEVRAVVAFLLTLPDLDAEGYERLVHGERPATVPAGAPARAPAEAVPGMASDAASVSASGAATAAASCARCHGHDGRGRGSAAFPRLAGQRREYLLGALEAYARGERHSGMMQPVATGLDRQAMRELAEHYSRMAGGPPSGGEATATAASLERGRQIATRGIPGQGVPVCSDCHGPEPTRRKPEYPELAGQYADYLVLQLELFADGRRGGSTYAHLMDHVAPGLEPDQRRDVAEYYASLPATGAPAGR